MPLRKIRTEPGWNSCKGRRSDATAVRKRSIRSSGLNNRFITAASRTITKLLNVHAALSYDLAQLVV